MPAWWDIDALLFTLAAAIITLGAAVYAAKSAASAERTVQLSEETVQLARQTVELAEVTRLEAERDRHRARLQKVGEHVIGMFEEARRKQQGGQGQTLRLAVERQKLMKALVGFGDELKECHRLVERDESPGGLQEIMAGWRKASQEVNEELNRVTTL